MELTYETCIFRIIHVRVFAGSKAVTKQEASVHLESRAKAPWVSGGKKKKRRRNCWKTSQAFQPVITVQLLWEEKKKVLVLPPEIGGYASMPKWMTGPFLISTKSSLVVLEFFSLSHTVRSSNFFRLVPLYLGLSTFLHFLERTQLCCPSFLND